MDAGTVIAAVLSRLHMPTILDADQGLISYLDSAHLPEYGPGKRSNILGKDPLTPT